MNNHHLDILNKHLAAENIHDMSGTLATLHADCLFEDIALQQVYHGRQGAEKYYNLWWNAFDLIVVSEKRHFVEDGTVIAESRYTGIHIGDFYGIAPTKRKIDFKIAVIISFCEELMSGERMYYDAHTLLNQLGVNNL